MTKLLSTKILSSKNHKKISYIKKLQNKKEKDINQIFLVNLIINLVYALLFNASVFL